MRYGMVIDLSKCLGCQACTVACKQKNATPPGVFWTRVLISESGSFPHVHVDYLPIQCMHCEDAACEKVCPTGATYKRPDGIVVVDGDKCIGCRYCMTACPYNARFFNYGKVEQYYPGKDLTPYEIAHQGEHGMGTVEKCNFCIDRVEAGLEPACVQTCPAGARYFGDLDDPDSEVARLVASGTAYQLHPELGTGPSIYYLPG